ncbi:all-trans retinoic acid-induced differentiation factor [Hemicordylus capensis]|uniref:all-trans retinoic acid-induced differentiation factor n=1 Tax=Hemicordylus capensis TaxID=884348 RepID=UPI00230326E1|nr:all-trans retinoic acid-induced differentiation factor [Hemicordylus capensis]
MRPVMAAPSRAAASSPGWPLLLLPPLLCLALLGPDPLQAGGAGAGPGAPGRRGVPPTGPGPAPSLQVCGGACCAGGVRASSAVAALCGSRGGARLQGRCCLDGALEREEAAAAVVVVGLDLWNCSLRELCPGFREARTAVLIDLTDNPLAHLPEDTFRGFTQLQTLLLPPELGCPGGGAAWDADTIRGSSRTCQGQQSPCNGSEGPAELCPEASLCAPDGPGLPQQCLCANPFHGYKCLRQGSFPYLLFYGSLGGATAALSTLLWATQRRKAKSS